MADLVDWADVASACAMARAAGADGVPPTEVFDALCDDEYRTARDLQTAIASALRKAYEAGRRDEHQRHLDALTRCHGKVLRHA